MTEQTKRDLSWVKPGVWGAVAGAIIVLIGGFWFGPLTTNSSAEEMAQARERAMAIRVLVPLCAERAQTNPEQLALFIAIESDRERQSFVSEAAWDDLPKIEGIRLGSNDQRQLRNACAEEIKALSEETAEATG